MLVYHGNKKAEFVIGEKTYGVVNMDRCKVLIDAYAKLDACMDGIKKWYRHYYFNNKKRGTKVPRFPNVFKVVEQELPIPVR